MKRERNGIRARAAMVALLFGTSGLMACESAEQARLDQAGTAEDSVTIALSTVPASTLCIRVTATPASGSATMKSFIVAPGATSASLSMGVLAPGSYNFAAEAFNVACTSVTGAGNWVADPVAVTVSAGVPTNVMLTFRKNAPVVVNANFVNNVKSITEGYFDTYAVTDSGILQAGANVNSAVLLRQNFAAFDPSLAPGNAVVSIAATVWGACALRVDGTVWCWGTDYNGELGGPGGGTITSLPVPTQIANVQQVTAIAAGWRHVCVAGATVNPVYYGVFCWGLNANGQLGDGTTVDSSTPVRATNVRAKFLAAGANASYMIDASGVVYAWGDNVYGQLGDGTSTEQRVPVRMAQNGPYRTISGGYWHACGLAGNGEVHCWGDNRYGQLGDGTWTNRLVPTLVPGLAAKQVVAGDSFSCALSTNGETVCWGSNGVGELGNRTWDGSQVPTPVALDGVVLTELSSQNAVRSTCGISTSRDVYCWGTRTLLVNGDSPSRVQVQ